MPTPFPVNATITFPGSIVVRCYLKTSNRQGRGEDDSTSGGEVVKMALEGRIDSVAIAEVLQTPAALPSTLLPGTVGAIVLSDLGGVAPNKEGEFYLELSADSAFGVSSALGAAIRGYMVQRVGWLDAL